MEPGLRQLGLPTALKKGVVTTVSDYEVWKRGDELTLEQARVLKLLWDIQLGRFQQLDHDLFESAPETKGEWGAGGGGEEEGRGRRRRGGGGGGERS
jgi:mRNA turnover protein 4